MTGTHKGMMIASAALGLALAGAVAARADQNAGDGTVHCAGINSCKGQGSCAGAGGSCKGMNDCKGKGVLDVPAAECQKKGGKVVKGE
jgi:uncharacterized membrane protein